MCNEIIQSDENNRLHKAYYDIIASEKIINLIEIITNNNLVISYARNIIKTSNLKYIGDLINEAKFPSSDRLATKVKFIINNSGPLLPERKIISTGVSYRDGFPLITNNLIQAHLITTKQIKSKLLIRNQNIEPIPDFCKLKTITHPKEKEVNLFR